MIDDWKKRLLIISIIIILVIVCRHTVIDWFIGTKYCDEGIHMIDCNEGTINLIREILPDYQVHIYLSNITMGEFGGMTIPPDSIIFFKGFQDEVIQSQRNQLFHEYFHTRGPITRILGWEGLSYNFYEEGLAEYVASQGVGYYDFKCLPDGVIWVQSYIKSDNLISGLLYYYNQSYGIGIDHYAKPYCLWKLTEERFGKEKTLGFVPVYHNITIGTYDNIERAYQEYFGVPPLIKAREE